MTRKRATACFTFSSRRYNLAGIKSIRSQRESRRQEEPRGEPLPSSFQAAGIGLLLAGPGAEIKSFNQTALDLLGVSEDKMARRSALDPDWNVIHEDGSPFRDEERPFARAFATRQPVRNVVMGVFRPRFEDRVWLLANAEPMLAADGTVREVVCSFTDITEHRRRLSAEWQNRYEAAMRASGQVLYDWNVETNDIVWGGDCEGILGYSAQELSGGLVRWMELVHPDDRGALQNEVDRLVANRTSTQIEYRVRSKSGRYLLVLDRGHFYADGDGRLTRMAGLVSDVTEKTRADQELRLSEERFRTVFANAALGMVLADLDGRIIEVNHAFCGITGNTEEELIGTHFRHITHPEDAPSNWSQFRDLVAGKVSSFVIEKRYVGNHGVVWCRNSVSLIRNSRGEPVRAAILVEDINERKHAEEALRVLAGKLLQAQDEERRRLARDLHDSTAQNIAALGMNLGVVSESAGALDARSRKCLEESVSLADQCIQDLRGFSYLLHPPLLDERGLSSALACYVEGFAERSGIAVALQVPQNLGRMPNEIELLLFRIVQESLTNIHRHSGSRTATIHIVRDPNKVFMKVQDQGSGIHSEGSVAGSTPPRLGVGIASMRERVRHIGGHLRIHSQPGGTDVEVTVPLALP